MLKAFTNLFSNPPSDEEEDPNHPLPTSNVPSTERVNEVRISTGKQGEVAQRLPQVTLYVKPPKPVDQPESCFRAIVCFLAPSAHGLKINDAIVRWHKKECEAAGFQPSLHTKEMSEFTEHPELFAVLQTEDPTEYMKFIKAYGMLGVLVSCVAKELVNMLPPMTVGYKMVQIRSPGYLNYQISCFGYKLESLCWFCTPATGDSSKAGASYSSSADPPLVYNTPTPSAPPAQPVVRTTRVGPPLSTMSTN
jgi:hypothetical protein